LEVAGEEHGQIHREEDSCPSLAHRRWADRRTIQIPNRLIPRRLQTLS
jgi:hypothetical protein